MNEFYHSLNASIGIPEVRNVVGCFILFLVLLLYQYRSTCDDTGRAVYEHVRCTSAYKNVGRPISTAVGGEELTVAPLLLEANRRI